MDGLERILERYDLQKLEAALERRRQREKRKLSRLMAKQRKLEAEVRKLAAVTAGVTERAQRTGLRRPNARRLNEITLGDALEQVLKARGKPTHYKDLTDAITKRKIYVTKSEHLLGTVLVTLKRDRRFRKLKPGLYALR